ncbi:MAG: CHAT domain-containing protein [Saprospiraceae bacterium]|nr:CHAT domain-containing protein [Saprospiraceae bacterium]MDW8483367.1 CHAT domain-containing tetratricopeptide repeat protein [Saprospiraceae bacterium]
MRWLIKGAPFKAFLFEEGSEACLLHRLRETVNDSGKAVWSRGLYLALLGLRAYQCGQMNLATAYFEVFHQIAIEAFGSDSEAVIDAELCLGRVWFAQQNYARALFHYERAFKNIGITRLQDQPHLVQVVEDMALAYERQGDDKRVCSLAETLLSYKQQQTLPDTAQLIRTLFLASAAHLRLASWHEAQKLLTRAQALITASSVKDTQYRIADLLLRAQLKAEEEAYSEATYYTLRALQQLSADPADTLEVLRAEVMLWIAELALLQKAYPLASYYLSRFELERLFVKDIRLRARTKILASQLLRVRRAHDVAERLLQEALQELKPLHLPVPELPAIYEQLAIVDLERGLFPQAKAYALAAIEHYQAVSSENHPNVLRTYMLLATLHHRMQEPAEGLPYVESAISVLEAPAFQHYGSHLLLLEALRVKAELLLKHYDKKAEESALQQAWSCVQRAYQLACQLRNASRALEQLMALHSRFERIAELGIAVAHRQYACHADDCWLEEAFDVAQRGKDFFWEPAITVMRSQRLDVFARRLLKRGKYLYALCLEQTTRYYRRLEAITSDSLEVVLGLAEAVAQANTAYHHFLDSLRRNVIALFVSYRTISPHKIVKLLKKREVVVDFFLGQQALYAFILSRKNPLELIELPIDSNLRELIANLKTAIASRAERMHTVYEPAYTLYRQIFLPLEQRLERRVEILAIIPHKELFDLPFEVLLSEQPKMEKADRVCDYAYLVRRYAFSYAYSANHWLHSRRRLVRWPESRSYILYQSDTQLRQGREEAKIISSIIGGVVLQDTLTKSQVLDSIGVGRIIHVVGHSLAAQGAVLHWRGKTSASTEHLYLPDIFTLFTQAHLVTLSACETALPSYYHPYGLSMTGAFSYARAACVLGTHWMVEDEATQKVMREFYLLLRKQRTESKAHALRAAQLSLIECRRQRQGHPYYWAAFRLYGNALAFERPERRAIRQAARLLRRLTRQIMAQT